MAKKRPVNNPLALAVLTVLTVRPMHPYEIASALRSTGKEESIKINWGSLYTVVPNLEKHGFIEEAGTTRQGGRPERTTYTITDLGRAELRDWLSELLGEPRKEYPVFASALSLVAALSPDEAIAQLERRVAALDTEIAAARADLDGWLAKLPRIFLIETEYALAMREAEVAWVRALLHDVHAGALPEIEVWRRFHETGELPGELALLPEED